MPCNSSSSCTANAVHVYLGHYGTSWDMALKKDRGSKTQTLSLRLDPKTKFTLEFVARIRGQTLTTIVERAIRESCDKVMIENFEGDELNWLNFWDPEEGMRT